MSGEAPYDVENIGWVTNLSGEAYIVRSWSEMREGVKVGTSVYINDSITTTDLTELTIEFDDDSAVAVGSNTHLIINEYVYDVESKENRSLFNLLKGSVRGYLNDLFGSRSQMSFKTTTSLVGVKGSDISVWVEDDESIVAVNEGHGFIRDIIKKDSPEIKIQGGYMVIFGPGKKVGRPVKISKKIQERILKLKIKRYARLIKKLKKKRIKHLLKKKKKKEFIKKYKEIKKKMQKKRKRVK
ncbi:MAG: FecR domain-containing protein [Deltaproteobacteria bacterium]|nr:FecR domain-containing protein [Deltaproteobacteria bacterium]